MINKTLFKKDLYCPQSSYNPTLITVGALGALVGSLHLKSLDVLLAGPTPAPFSAMTRNSYSLPSVRLVTRCLSSVMDLLEETLTQRRLFFSLLSKMYCLISLPPSDLGLVQHRVMLFPVTWVASGVPGTSGTAVEDRFHEQSHESGLEEFYMCSFMNDFKLFHVSHSTRVTYCTASGQ